MESNPQSIEQKKVLRALVMVFALGFICLQIFRWQTYAFEVTWLSFKSATLGLSFQDHVRFGKICNSIENYDCSEEQFGQAYSLNSKHLPSLGNLAIAQSHLDDIEVAMKSFEQYFKAGGLAYDVMQYYAQFLINNGHFDRGIQWLYRSLSIHTSNQEVANELIDYLTVEERFYEALSLIGALVEIDPGSVEFWKTKQQSLMQFLETQTAGKNGKPDVPVETQVRIPSLDGKSYFMPVRYDASTPWSLFLLDRGEPDIVISGEILSKWSYQLYEELKVQLQNPKAKVKFKLEHLRIGPWVLEDVEAILCEKCQSRLGRSIYNYLDLQKGEDQIFSFLTIQSQTEEEE